MLHEAAEMCEGGPDAQLTPSLETESSGIRGQAERLPLDELRMLASACPTSVGIPLKRSYMGPVLFSMQTAACAGCSRNVNEIFLPSI
jgi:hypothetical protein